MTDLTKKLQKNETPEKPESFWNPSEQAEIVKALTVIADAQKAYGRDASVKDLFAYFRMKLDGRFPAGHVLSALDLYTDTKNDIPAPADIIALMTPPAKPMITTAEFLHAKEQHKLEGFPAYGYYGQIIRQYEGEQNEGRAPIAPIEERRIGMRPIAELIGNVKAIENKNSCR